MKNEVKIWHLILGLFGVMVIIITIVFMMFSSMGLKVNAVNSNIVVAVITTIGVLGAAAIAKDYKSQKIADNKPDLSTPNYDDMIGHLIDNIQERMNAYRCAYWVYTNGTYTGDDYSMQNCSMVVEKNKEDVVDVIAEMQMIPKVQFRRNISPLRDHDYHISYEDEHKDSLANFNAAYGVKTAIYFKVKNGDKWTGVLGISYNESHHPIPLEDIGWVLVQVSRIEAIIRSMKKK